MSENKTKPGLSGANKNNTRKKNKNNTRTIVVRVRSGRVEGGTQALFHVSNTPSDNTALRHVKTQVIDNLQRRWDQNGTGVQLKHDNIKVFLVCGAEAKEVGKDLKPLGGDQQQNDSSDQFVALELFTRVPENLLRTVHLAQLEPAVFAHPEQVNRAFTKVSPLYCAGFHRRKDEHKVPWIEIKQGRKNSDYQYKLHGVSLRCEDESEQQLPDDATPKDPFRVIDEVEKIGVVSMTIDQCMDSVDEYVCHNGNFGFLKSSVTMTNDDSRFGLDWKKDKIEVPGDETNNAKVTKRLVNVRFKLKKDLDISDYGVAVICDCSSRGHYTLVPLSFGEVNANLWKTFSTRETDVHLPKDLHKQVEDALVVHNLPPETLPEELHKTTNIFRPDAQKDAQSFSQYPFLYLPKVAALFGLHDLQLEASAEPTALKGSGADDTDCQLLYKGAFVLHHLDLGWHVEIAIQALEKAGYKVSNLGQPFRDTLIETCSGGMPDAEDAASIRDLDYDEAVGALDAMHAALMCDSSSEENPKPSAVTTTADDHRGRQPR